MVTIHRAELVTVTVAAVLYHLPHVHLLRTPRDVRRVATKCVIASMHADRAARDPVTVDIANNGAMD